MAKKIPLKRGNQVKTVISRRLRAFLTESSCQLLYSKMVKKKSGKKSRGASGKSKKSKVRKLVKLSKSRKTKSKKKKK